MHDARFMTSQIPSEPPPATYARTPMLAATKAEAVYLETRRRILTGVLPPGLNVNQESLAADLGVSITPLREALRRLEMQGLIRLEAHRTVVIAPLTGRELDELYVIRIDLDSSGLAASEASDADIGTISQLARQKPAREPVAQLERNRAFHRAIYASCGNGALVAYLDQLWDRTDRYPLILVKQELVGGAASRQEHIDIADAVADRDAESAARLTRDHIARSRTQIADIMSSRPKAEASQ